MISNKVAVATRNEINRCTKLTILVIALLGLAAHAETYRYEGDDGAVVFTDDASKIPRKKGKVKRIPDGEPGPPPALTARVDPPPPQEQSPRRSRTEGPDIRRKYLYWDIGGYTFRDIGREIRKRSPYWRIGNQAAFGWCSWNVSWQINMIQDGNLCRITSIDTVVPISITMARWANYASADAGMKEAWDIYYRVVLAHEERHASHGVEPAREIERLLPELPARYSCRDIKEDGEVLGRRIVSEQRQKDVELDKAEGDGFDMLTDVDVAADKREGVVGRQYFQRRDGRSR
jgi:predicted secreted Zn-dependent protease